MTDFIKSKEYEDEKKKIFDEYCERGKNVTFGDLLDRLEQTAIKEGIRIEKEKHI